ncbi:MAG: hypothetical protein CO128_03265 [Ignavibacteriales bacterium CG_4_9_14_3_um_filter_30_11]|nr:MAG: hypothetical protein CO128_03265 [Ignavibacteriales bacterium CG_4_9_14_3_um_filter_30_11]
MKIDRAIRESSYLDFLDVQEMFTLPSLLSDEKLSLNDKEKDNLFKLALNEEYEKLCQSIDENDVDFNEDN